MAGIAGALHLDGSGEAPRAAERMLAALAHRGRAMRLHDAVPAAIGRVSAVTAAIGGRDFPAGIFVVLDGRVDNRKALADRLGCPSHTDESVLIAHAYARWGDAFLDDVLGDFSLALWDDVGRRLLCARDPVGVKPFFYAATPHRFLFASELRAIFAGGELERSPNEGFLAELLADRLTSRDETPFRAIRRLPPAHVLAVDDRGVAIRRYWTPRPSDAPERSDDDCAERFRTLLADAVRCRMDGREGVAVALSGGLDSSSIAALARDERRGAVPPRTCSLVFPGQPCDESRYVAEVERALGLPSTRVPAERWTGEALVDEAWRDFECGDTPNGAAMIAPLFAAARAAGAGVILTGDGGDEWVGGSFFRYADMLRSGDLRRFAREVRRAPHPATAFPRALVFGVWPLLPDVVRRPVRAAWRLTKGTSLPSWIDAAFARRTNLEDRTSRPRYDSTSGWPLATWAVAQFLTDGVQCASFETRDRWSRRAGIEERHPFYDRRVVEYALSLPESQRTEGGETKRVLRRAMRGMLPDTVRCRRDKADFSPVIFDALVRQGGEQAFEKLAIAAEGFVDEEALKRAYRRTAGRLSRGLVAPDLMALWQALSVDAWFRAAILGAPRPASPREIGAR